MAISLKKIGAIAVGGAMVASTLASGVVAGDVVERGDVAGFMKNVVKDGEPNVEIVVGSKAAAMDVVSAADIAAKIGSMCYKEEDIEDASATLKIKVSADTELSDDLKREDTFRRSSKKNYTLIFTTPKRSYTNNLGDYNILSNLVNRDENDIAKPQNLARLSTLIKDDDADPDDISDNKKADAIEFLLASVKNNSNKYTIEKECLVYGTLILDDGGKKIADAEPLWIGMEVPLLGEIYRIADTDGKTIYLGKEAYSGNVKEGEVIDVGNGYQVKVNSVLQPINTSEKPEVDIKIIKDGKVVESKSGKIPFEFVYKDVGVIVYSAYKNIAGTHGFASLIVIKDIKNYELGKTFTGDWKLYGLINDNGIFDTTKEDFKEKNDKSGKTKYLKEDRNNGKEIVGLVLRYEGDDIKNLEEGDTVKFVNDYTILEFTNDGEDGKLFVKYKMEVSKETTLEVGSKTEILNAELRLKNIEAKAQQVVPVKTPIAKLDKEVSLTTDKYLILVGGPVANKLSEELQKEGKIDITNESPATLQVVDDKILVVAGGDRDKTRDAALYLIRNY